MPALTSLSKEDIIERLTLIIRRQEGEIERLKSALAIIYKKIDHGCTDANCEMCDAKAEATEAAQC